MRNLLIALFAVFALGFVAIAADKEAPKAVNEKCPLSGKAVDASKTADVTVKFCCEKCKAKFDAAPAEHLAKALKDTSKCPMSGKETGDASSTVKVAFCCGKCLAKAAPAK